MIEIINESRIVKARKDYRDDTREFIMEDWNSKYNHIPYTDEERAKIEKAISENWKIRKGELHEYGVFKADGHIYSFRNKIGMSRICIKYKLYPED